MSIITSVYVTGLRRVTRVIAIFLSHSVNFRNLLTSCISVKLLFGLYDVPVDSTMMSIVGKNNPDDVTVMSSGLTQLEVLPENSCYNFEVWG